MTLVSYPKSRIESSLWANSLCMKKTLFLSKHLQCVIEPYNALFLCGRHDRSTYVYQYLCGLMQAPTSNIAKPNQRLPQR